MENTNKEMLLCMSLAHMYSRQPIKPFYWDLNRCVINGTLQQQDFINKLKNGIVSVKSMGSATEFTRLDDTSIELSDYYQDDIIKLARIDINKNGKLEWWVVSNVDFTAEYQAFLISKEKDEVFYQALKNDSYFCRKAHNALMDILDRDSQPSNKLALRALDTLEIKPVYQNENELKQIVAEIQKEMRWYCDSFNIHIDAMTTLSPSEIIDIRDYGRTILRDKNLDSLIIEQAALIKENVEIHGQLINSQEINDGGAEHERT